jgi:hypothetical protein
MRIFLPRLLFLYDFFFLYLLLGLVRATGVAGSGVRLGIYYFLALRSTVTKCAMAFYCFSYTTHHFVSICLMFLSAPTDIPTPKCEGTVNRLESAICSQDARSHLVHTSRPVEWLKLRKSSLRVGTSQINASSGCVRCSISGSNTVSDVGEF